MSRKTSTAPPRPVAFISYAHPDRQYGGQVKTILADLDIDGFLAHEDLHVSDEWQERILQELRRCDLFVALLSKDFLASKWAPQEVGFVISRQDQVTIIPIAVDETVPFGFLSHLQSRRISPTGVAHSLFIHPLMRHMPRKVLPALIRLAGRSASFRDAEAKVEALVPYFGIFTSGEADAFAAAAAKNGQIWAAKLCRDRFLPEFMRLHANRLTPETARALQFQIENQCWYPGEEHNAGD